MAAFDLEAALDRATAEPASRRAEILKAAERLFAKHGFEGVRVRDVAGAAGVNAATLHLHWKSKAVLYEAVCRLHARELFAFAAGIARRPDTDLLEGQVDAAVEFMTAHPYIASLALQSVADQTPHQIPTLFNHDVSAFRAVEELARKELGPEEGGAEPMLAVLTVFYFTAVLFCDSPLQQALLGGSVYEDAEIRERVARFAKSLVARLAGS